MAHSMDETDERQHFNGEENNNSAEDNPSSVASFSAFFSFDYSERPPPYQEIEEIPSSRWLSPSFAWSEPDEISPGIPAAATSPSVASPSYVSELRKKPSSFRWSRFLPPPFRKERTISRPRLSFLQQDEQFSEILKGIYRFTFEEIREATNDFEDRNIIGRGGSTVTYRGLLQRHNKIVAVKLFITETCGNSRNLDYFRNDTHVSSRLRHRNITGFLGYCIHKEKFMLIYEYEQNGSLDRLLFTEDKGETLLGWRIRYKICLEIANGLAYLHKERIIHRDIKPSNILLDADFVPKIQDFSLAECMSEDMTKFTTMIAGTLGYIDPEYLKTGQLTEKAGVYSYGSVILEIVSGKRMRDLLNLKLHETLSKQGNLLEFVDPRLGSAYSEEEALTLLKLSALCTKMPSESRPSIAKVVNVLEGKLRVHELNYKQLQDDIISGLDYPSLSEKEIGDMKTNDDACTTPPMKFRHPSEDDEISEILKGIHRFTFEEIKDATNDFDNQNIIRETNGLIYRGSLDAPIAVQMDFFKEYRRENYQEFKNKIYFLSRLNHPNITRLFGYCMHNNEFMLIYEYTCKASFLCYNREKQLQSDNGKKQLQLNWERRYNICLGIAKGLAYFHINSRQGAAGGGIKTASIFLDENFNPKMWSFHLTNAYKTYLTSGDCHSGKGLDIYIYGVVILELVSGTSFENNRYQLHETQKERGNLLKFVDPRLGSAYSEEQALLLLKLSELCTNNSEHKPSIITVLGVLEGKQKFEELNGNQLEDKGITGLDYSSSSKTQTGAEISSEQMRILEEVDFILGKRGIHEFTFREIHLATTNFTDRIQGCANVYLGILPRGVLPDGHQIAVKRFLTSSNITVSELHTEIFPFNDSRHPNIARILGFCRERHVGVMLIYEFMLDRTLSHFLRQQERLLELDMTRRFDICLGVAKGLAYLLQNNFIHGDIKPMNILLDEDFNPKIINLSPTKSMREDMTYVTTKGVGAFGYLDLEYLQSGKITKEGDVYSYGVVVLELVSGKRFFEVNVCQLHECLNKQGNLLQFVDPQLIDSDDSREKALILLELSVLCTKQKPADRPSITEVVSKLEGDIYDMEPSKEQVIQENPTTEICSHEAFEKLRALVLSNSLEEALREKIKMEIFHLCEILDGSTFLPEARSGLALRVKDFLAFTSQLSIVCKEDSSYDEDSKLAPLDEKMKLLNLQNPAASDSSSIIELAKSLMESRKVAAKRRLIHTKKCIDKGKEDWKFIQTRFK